MVLTDYTNIEQWEVNLDTNDKYCICVHVVKVSGELSIEHRFYRLKLDGTDIGWDVEPPKEAFETHDRPNHQSLVYENQIVMEDINE